MTDVGYPETCKEQVKQVSKALHMDEDTAYACIAMYSILTDLSPTDPELIQMVIDEYGGSEVVPVA